MGLLGCIPVIIPEASVCSLLGEAWGFWPCRAAGSKAQGSRNERQYLSRSLEFLPRMKFGWRNGETIKTVWKLCSNNSPMNAAVCKCVSRFKREVNGEDEVWVADHSHWFLRKKIHLIPALIVDYQQFTTEVLTNTIDISPSSAYICNQEMKVEPLFCLMGAKSVALNWISCRWEERFQRKF